MADSIVLSPETIERIREKMSVAKLNESDIEERFVKGGGHGGQKVNKTSSCVQLLHLPSGTQIRCQETRSREANRWLARRLLAERILEAANSRESARIAEAEKIRRQKRRRSRKQKARMLDDKRLHSAKKALRGKVVEE